MNPQAWTPHHQSLKTYLLDVVKLPAEKFRFADTHGSAKGKIDDFVACTLLPATDPNAPPDYFQQPPEPELRFTNAFSIHLVIKEFDGVLSFFIGQLLYWLREEKQDIEFEYRVYWSNEASCNLECFLEIEERGKGSISTGFNMY